MAQLTYPLTIDTIGKLINADHIAFGWCVPESTSLDIDLPAPAEAVGRD